MLKKSILLISTLLFVTAAAVWKARPMLEAQEVLLENLLLIYLIVALGCFIVSEITKNYSQVDRIWSLIPIVYAWVSVVELQFHPRTVLVAVLISIWGIRLTYNFSRLGAYKWPFWHAHEDYRWQVLQNKPEFSNPWIWRIFNLFFISLYQNGLILYFTLPIIFSNQNPDLGIVDYGLTLALIAVVIMETVADNQQWEFQKAKKRTQGDFGKGFIDTGLWKYSRHPNYFAEQLFWIGIYLFSVIATGDWINWTIGGCLLLIVLFQGSSDFSESISVKKYPEYKNYQKRVGRFIPFLNKKN